MPSPRDFKVGQTVFLADHWRQDAPLREATVKTVGRKWVFLEYGVRFDPARMVTDTTMGSGEDVYLSREDHDGYRAARKLWIHFIDRCRVTNVPDIDAIRSAASALGITLEES